MEQITLTNVNATMDVVRPSGENSGEAMLVIPGGGYASFAVSREGKPIAEAFAAYGMTAFILHYALDGDGCTVKPLVQASAAVAYLRENAAKYNINHQKIYAVGFSAGGHLAASLATMCDLEEVRRESGVAEGKNRLNGVILCYPVISPDCGHMASFYHLLRTNTPKKEDLAYYDILLRVSETTPPSFLMHTANDQCVPVKNSLLYAEMCENHHVPFELHVYPDAPHGLALANEITEDGNPDWVRPQAARWVGDAVYFLRHLKNQQNVNKQLLFQRYF